MWRNDTRPVGGGISPTAGIYDGETHPCQKKDGLLVIQGISQYGRRQQHADNQQWRETHDDGGAFGHPNGYEDGKKLQSEICENGVFMMSS